MEAKSERLIQTEDIPSSIMAESEEGQGLLTSFLQHHSPLTYILHKGNDRRLFWSPAFFFADIAAHGARASPGLTVQFLLALSSYPHDNPAETLEKEAQL